MPNHFSITITQFDKNSENNKFEAAAVFWCIKRLTPPQISCQRIEFIEFISYILSAVSSATGSIIVWAHNESKRLPIPHRTLFFVK